MSRGHTPYGYRIENGIAYVDESKAEQIRTIFKEYTSGNSLVGAAAAAGMKLTHSSVKRILAKRMMQNSHLLGDDFYPALIDQATYDGARAERQTRLELMARDYVTKTRKQIKQASTSFHMNRPTEAFTNPFRQAEYIYSLIESEG